MLSRCREQVFLHPVICLNFYRIERSQRASSPKLFENNWTKVWLKTLRVAPQKMRRKTCPKAATRRIVIWKVLKEKKLLAFGRINLLQEGGGETKSCPLLCSALLCSDPCLIPLLLQQLDSRGKEGRGYSIINCWGVQPLRSLTQILKSSPFQLHDILKLSRKDCFF